MDNFKSLRNKRILIFGFGKTGQAVCRVLKETCPIIVFDEKDEAEFKELIKDIDFRDVKFYFENFNLDFQKNDLIVMSPGISIDKPYLSKAKELNIPIISEIELAYQIYNPKNIITISGTDGKTTTTILLYEILKSAGMPTKLAGNIGFPLIQELKNAKIDDYIVTEVSSFQLETIKYFKPKISVMLNIAEDHLDRHKNLKNYISEESKIFLNQTPLDYAILNYDNKYVYDFHKKTNAKVIFFSQTKKLDKGVFVDEDRIHARVHNKEIEIINICDIRIKGRHNLENCLAVISVCTLLNLNKEIIKEVLKEFKGVEHRQEEVAEIGGVKFINDSKATTPHSAISALKAFNAPIILIAGGRSKKLSFSEFAKEIANRVKKLILIGEASDEIESEVKKYNFHQIEKATNLEDAVNIAIDVSKEGDVVLLSPACASLDMFKDYEERGNIFKSFVKEKEKKLS